MSVFKPKYRDKDSKGWLRPTSTGTNLSRGWFWSPANLRVFLFQILESFDPLVERKAAQGRHSHRPVKPIRRFAAPEVEVPVGR